MSRGRRFKGCSLRRLGQRPCRAPQLIDLLAQCGDDCSNSCLEFLHLFLEMLLAGALALDGLIELLLQVSLFDRIRAEDVHRPRDVAKLGMFACIRQRDVQIALCKLHDAIREIGKRLRNRPPDEIAASREKQKKDGKQPAFEQSPVIEVGIEIVHIDTDASKSSNLRHTLNERQLGRDGTACPLRKHVSGKSRARWTFCNLNKALNELYAIGIRELDEIAPYFLGIDMT